MKQGRAGGGGKTATVFVRTRFYSVCMREKQQTLVYVVDFVSGRYDIRQILKKILLQFCEVSLYMYK